jgi:hypothetical protein
MNKQRQLTRQFSAGSRMLGGKLRRRHPMALATMTATVVAGISVMAAPAEAVSATPAHPARTEQVGQGIPGSGVDAQICLENAPAYCTYFDASIVYNAVLATINTGILVYETILKSKVPNGSKKGDQEVEDKVDGGTDGGECLTATGGNVTYASCSADGTVWIAVPNGNGYRFDNRYSYDNGNDRYLSSRTATGGAQLSVQAASSNYWQTWYWDDILDIRSK